MNTYRIAWLEYVRAGDTLEGLPNATITGNLMGDDEVECWDEFEAANDEQAKQIALKNYDEVPVFNVSRDGKLIFTEEEENYHNQYSLNELDRM